MLTTSRTTDRSTSQAMASPVVIRPSIMNGLTSGHLGERHDPAGPDVEQAHRGVHPEHVAAGRDEGHRHDDGVDVLLAADQGRDTRVEHGEQQEAEDAVEAEQQEELDRQALGQPGGATRLSKDLRRDCVLHQQRRPRP